MKSFMILGILFPFAATVGQTHQTASDQTWHPLLTRTADGTLTRNTATAKDMPANPSVRFLELGSTVMAPVNDRMCACRLIEESRVTAPSAQSPTSYTFSPRGALTSTSPVFRQISPISGYAAMQAPVMLLSPTGQSGIFSP
ncbi:hypothetical protein TGRUB_289660 [Toxoplasma gondii RUB]|uniref:Uncharacterized protein n=5 Tax=Toxoplasma gondii TaxID=5811 RepID=B9PTN5_TOXGV|nr:hypothetical protein TGGT1_289660 [Toxoplasma gondii GT1]ESS33698.1 hypothetical protein TGVEG_289660 [Toxoplasma gondii VEG]KAF4644447.1 hypothetical protein TGRH88_014410 [Toxoplasma gondii]KFG33310.1 hypothetical protein TGP89_289660 [Toxoplasma gondii p89]KFG62701.1 hypothetical protein TGRUB_289660 [Toxoplasma gondii RUB]